MINLAPTRNNKTIDSGNAREFDNLLTYLSLCEKTDCRQPDGNLFDGAYLYGEQSGLTGLPPENTAKLARSIERWHGKLVLIAHADDSEYDISRFYELTPEQTAWRVQLEPHRWQLNNATGIMTENYHIKLDGKIYNAGSFLAYKRGGRLLLPRSLEDDVAEALPYYWANAVCCLWGVENLWSVKVRITEGTPAIGFFTDPTGIKELMKFREIPDGKSRRDPMIHWVSQHWRQNRYDPDVEIYVREFLRGTRKVQWHGMGVEVVIPDVDAQRIETGKEHRKRLAGNQLAKRKRRKS